MEDAAARLSTDGSVVAGNRRGVGRQQRWEIATCSAKKLTAKHLVQGSVIKKREARPRWSRALMFSNKARLIAAVALLICVLCSSM